MTKEEKKHSLKKLDKLIIDSENLINQAKEKAKSETLKVYLRELAIQRRELLSEIDEREKELRDKIEEKGTVGGSMQGIWMKDADFSSEEAILKEVYNGEKFVLGEFEKEMGKPVDKDYKEFLDDSSRILIRNVSTMKQMIDSNEIHA